MVRLSDDEKKYNFCHNTCKANKNNGKFCCMTYFKPFPLTCEWIYINDGKVEQLDMPVDL